MIDLEKQRAIAKLKAIPCLKLGFYPTPVEEMPRLQKMVSDEIGRCPRLFIKHDDYTGVGFGGNKVRKLEYALAQAVADGADVIITTGGEKSNHARVTASICARIGLQCILVTNPATPGSTPRGLRPASIYIDELAGAEIHRISSRAEREPAVAAIAAKLRAGGKRVAEIPIGASVPLGALGFVSAVQELAAQCEQLGVKPDYIFHASSSAGTQAGIVTGCQLFGLENVRVIGVSPDDPASEIASNVRRIAEGAFELLGLSPPADLAEQITVLDDYIGPGYGLDSAESARAIELTARAEGIILDPAYTAKAMAGLLDQIGKGMVDDQETVLFWHTGGQLALFFRP